MSPLNRRTLLACLAAVAAGPALAAVPGGPPVLDQAAVKRIGQAYLATRPLSRAALERDLFPRGPIGVASLRKRVAWDFRQGELFIHEGWRLSDTEGRLFALYALTG